ncbi:MAG: orotidine-5'-phosphate decarboxylase [Gemmatimonadetes bacterium]|nr:orotidine-5'-phosphate decarboxylase [Gemmatimonadota bacterium]
MAQLILALDTPTADEALRLVDRIGGGADFYKVGLELYTRAGPSVVDALHTRKKRVFLDLKLHDIPNTVAGAVAAASDLGVDLLTLHAAGGRAMLEAARQARRGRLALLGVTVLTSLSAEDLGVVWGRVVTGLTTEVVRLATTVKDAGLAGVVSAPAEVASLRARFGSDFLLVAPGIRLPESERGDQKRVATPGEAVRSGADYLVVGRAVTAAPDPLRALDAVHADMARG